MLDHYKPRYVQLCVFQRILHIRLNTFRVFPEYADRLKNTQKGICTFNNDCGFYRDSISKK
jgi:hypothetical protein